MGKLQRIQPIIPVEREKEKLLGPDWVYEIKYDGFRAMLYISGKEAFFLSKTGNVMTRFQILADLIKDILKVKSAILDGEIACLDLAGRSVFNNMLRGSSERTYVAFDLLHLNGKDLTQLPQEERKTKLLKLTRGLMTVMGIQSVDGPFNKIWEFVERFQLEGLVAKKKTDPYSRHSIWYKILNKEGAITKDKEVRKRIFGNKKKE